MVWLSMAWTKAKGSLTSFIDALSKILGILLFIILWREVFPGLKGIVLDAAKWSLSQLTVLKE